MHIFETGAVLMLGFTAIAGAGGSACAAEPDNAVIWISSTEAKPWQTMPAPELVPADPNTPPVIRVAPDRAFQVMEGFGGCFNEMGWVALGKASQVDRDGVMAALFGDEGCAFNLARLPIGSSDFALDAYSYVDTPGDFDLKTFSIDRDKQQLIPFVKAAMKVRPTLRCWGSPWSPPAWMKDNNNYSKGSLRWEPQVLKSYAEYFVRWYEAYSELGIDIYAISPQNEPNILNVYPTCLWTGPQLREFIADYLGPKLAERGIEAELWLGLNGDPFNGGDNVNDRLVTVLGDPKANGYVTGVAYQYDSRNQIAEAHALYPDKKFMESETNCNGGDNSWADAEQLYQLMKRYIDGGAGSYFAWNMVLDDTGLSHWGWRQNALVTVDHETGKVTYNGEYYVMRHFSRFIQSGARRVLTTGVWGDKIAFINPDGSIVMVIGNSADRPYGVSLAIADRPDADTLHVQLPPHSINTFVVPAP